MPERYRITLVVGSTVDPKIVQPLISLDLALYGQATRPELEECIARIVNSMKSEQAPDRLADAIDSVQVRDRRARRPRQ